MYATNAEYNGIALNDIGLYIVSFDSNKTGVIESGGEIVWNISKAINNHRWNLHGKHYESPLSTKIQVAKYNCQSQQVDEISVYEQAYYKRLLEDVDTYKPFRILCDDYEDIYYMATMQIQWYQVGGSIIGAEITITCNAPYGFSPIQQFSTTVDTNGTFQIYNDSNKIGLLSMDLIEIKALSDGDIKISNDMDMLYCGRIKPMVIANCHENEVIQIVGTTEQISSYDESHTTIADDYNYEPLHLINFDQYNPTTQTVNLIPVQYIEAEQQRINNFINKGCPIEINIAYRTVRTAVIPI